MIISLQVILIFVVLAANCANIPLPSPPSPIPEPPTVLDIEGDVNPDQKSEKMPTSLTVTSKAQHRIQPISKKKKSRSHSHSKKHQREIEGLNEKCNDLTLREIMMDSISPSLSESKMVISEQSAREFGAQFDIICARGLFSYFVEATTYCEVSKDGTTCFAYRSTKEETKSKKSEED